MTRKQLGEAQVLQSWLERFYPSAEWHAGYNYYTKLIDFTGLTKQGGFTFGMHRHYSGTVSIYLTYNSTTKAEENGMIVSHGFGTDLVREELPRINFAKYLEFVRQNAHLVVETIAVV